MKRCHLLAFTSSLMSYQLHYQESKIYCNIFRNYLLYYSRNVRRKHVVNFITCINKQITVVNLGNNNIIGRIRKPGKHENFPKCLE